MNYRIEQLAAVSGVRADTIRFYQGRGLLAPPQRSGRIAVYGEAHRKRLGRIRTPEVAGNLTWGGAELRTLFGASHHSVVNLTAGG